MAKTIAENLVEEWDTNNAMCLLGDHRDDLVNNIESALLTVAREAAETRPQGWEWYHEHDAALIRRDGMMCEQHPGTEFPHDDCAGPGMAWCVESRDAIQAFASSVAREQRERDAGIADAEKRKGIENAKDKADPEYDDGYSEAAQFIAQKIRTQETSKVGE